MRGGKEVAEMDGKKRWEIRMIDGLGYGSYITLGRYIPPHNSNRV